MEHCCICCNEFENVKHFEIQPNRCTGVLCKIEEGHPICNICFILMYPRNCPICKIEMTDKEFGVSEQLSISLKSQQEATMKQRQEIEEYEMLTRLREEEMCFMNNICMEQRSVMFGLQLIVSSINH